MTETERAIADAMQHYGLGRPLRQQKTAYIAADIENLTHSAVTVSVFMPNLPLRRCEFLLSEISIQYFGGFRAVIALPRTYIPIFVLWDYVLEGKTLEIFERRVAEFNAAYLKQNHRPEKIGNVRV